MKRPGIEYSKLAVLAVLAAAGLVSISSTSSSEANTARRSASAHRQIVVPTLHSIDSLKQAFQRDAGKVRLVTILSPT